MGAPDLLQQLRGAGLVLTSIDSGLHVAPREALTDEHRVAIRAHRAELLGLVAGTDAANESGVAAPATCADCRHLLPHGTCGEPVSAGLMPRFGIVWPPDGHGAACPVFSGRTPSAAAIRPYRLARDEGDRCHAGVWDDGEMASFEARHARLLRAGYCDADAEDLAERLTLRDRDGDDRRLCAECKHYRPGRCGNHGSAGLRLPYVGRDLAATLQRCAGFLLVRG